MCTVTKEGQDLSDIAVEKRRGVAVTAVFYLTWASVNSGHQHPPAALHGLAIGENASDLKYKCLHR